MHLAPPPVSLANAPTTTEADWLRFEGITKQFGTFKALSGIDLNVRKGEFLCLLGPSGCGKTTLLRILAGLEHHDAGRLTMAGRDIGHLPPAKRDYGIVFQSYALFPNLTIAENIGYGLRTSRVEKARRVESLLDMVGLAGSGHKYPSQISGGQQQRVALARALATSPSLLLLDEPLSALDAQVREHLRRELRQLQQKLGVTTIMVTHDQEEALTMADTIAVMHQGRIEQTGSPEAIYSQPASRFVAEFVGRANWLPVEGDEAGTLRLGGIALALDAGTPRYTGPGLLFCRPEDVKIDAHWLPGDNSLMAFVERVEFLGGIRRATLSLSVARHVTLLADVSPNDPGIGALQPGQLVPIHLPAKRLQVFPRDTA
ncbi:MAG: putative 2-aminoethylphosphonate ABC transporter ATP-binding protein [Burkholderiales bacterium]|nr:putative 2-aminoethylphosphonate ABC transporter ATP-binding protein [Burkholderiales bacterium]